MAEGREAARRPARPPLRQRSRRRWAVTGGVAACWVVLEVVTGSAVSATVVLVAIAGLGAASIGGLRALGVTRNHPWLRQLASRPWRDGQDVLKVALRHLPDVFVVTPNGLLLAPNVVDLQLNPGDLVSLCGQMELGVISSSVTEVYEEQVAAHGARFAGPGRADVRVIAAGSVPPGRYRLRQFLRGSVLRGSVLRGSVLRGSVLRSRGIRRAPVPSLTALMSGIRTSRRSSSMSPRNMPTPPPDAASGRNQTRA